MKNGKNTLTKVIVITLIAAVVITYSVSVVAYLF
jgi:hypothetical protein